MDILILYAILIPAIVLVFMSLRMRTSKDHTVPGISKRGYALFYSPWIILLYPLTLSIIVLVMGDASYFIEFLMNIVMEIGIVLVVYYMLVLIFRRICKTAFYADTLVILWLLPNVLYVRMLNYFNSTHPLYYIYIPGNVMRWLCLIWLAGFILVFGWHMKRHFDFERELFQKADLIGHEDEEDRRIHEIWMHELVLINKDAQWEATHGDKHSLTTIALYRSSMLQTPLSIGLTHMKVVLPDRYYTDEELSWIFRHELIHIVNHDSSNKLFMLFFGSLGWFLPMMWMMVRDLGEDIELSCDEKILAGQSQETRRFYANLLLKTGGENRGITTCLSARGKTMRYRLKHVIEGPKSRPVRNVLVVTFFSLLLCLGYGLVGISLNRGSLAEFVIDDKFKDYDISACYYTNDEDGWGDSVKHDIDPDLVEAYMKEAVVDVLPKLNHNRASWFSSSEDFTPIHVTISSEEKDLSLMIEGNYISTYFSASSEDEMYYEEEYLLRSGEDVYEFLQIPRF